MNPSPPLILAHTYYQHSLALIFVCFNFGKTQYQMILGILWVGLLSESIIGSSILLQPFDLGVSGKQEIILKPILSI